MGDNSVAAAGGQGSPGAATSAASEVMIVDDEPITARGYARALTAAGYTVTLASAGRGGAALAKTKRVDAVVSDLARADRGGPAPVRELQQTALDVPVLFLTGSPAA